jgi:antitoxin CptB
MASELETRRRRASWRAGHRGSKEMDLLLGRYSDALLPTFVGEDLARFERLLELPDPDLQNAILTGAPHEDPEIAEQIAAIRAFHGLAPSTS